jgi:hypothetical protein
MSTVEEYKSGEAAKAVKTAWQAMKAIEGDLAADEIGKVIIDTVRGLSPQKIELSRAAELIAQADKCAKGERVCRCQFPGSPRSESVFLDELAEGLVQAGKAEFVTPGQAVKVLENGKGKPIVVTKVEGKYMEICRTWHEHCVYWNLEKRGVRCLGGDESPGRRGSARRD